jgi:hypothetical protein
MNAFEKGLLSDIPVDEASSFFLKVTGRDKVAQADIESAWSELSPEEQQEVLKEANAAMTPMGQPPSPASMAPVQPPALPPTGQGQNSVKAASEKKEKKSPISHRVGESIGRHHDTVSGVLGALSGAGSGAAGARRSGLGGAGQALGAAIGATAGYYGGRATGRVAQGVASGLSHAHKSKYEKHKEAMARAFSKMAQGEVPPDAVPTSPSGEEEPSLEEYMQNELVGQQAEEQASAEYFKQRFQQASQQLQQTQAQASETQAMTDQLQQQVAQSQEQIQAAMQQAQMAQQSAMSNVQQAHEMAMNATSQAMESQAEVLKQKQLAAAMRMGVQQLKDNVMNAMAQDPTDQLAQQLQAPPPGTGGPVGGGMQQPGMAVDPMTGQPAQDPNAMAAQDPNAAAQGAPQQAAPQDGGEQEPSGEKKEKSEKKDDGKEGTTKVEVKHAAARFQSLAAKFKKAV